MLKIQFKRIIKNYNGKNLDKVLGVKDYEKSHCIFNDFCSYMFSK